MPDLWTHYYFAQDVNEKNKLNIHNKHLYYLGAQGPDFLYALYFSSPKKQDSWEMDYASMLHGEKTCKLIKFVKDNLDNSDVLRDYLMGFLAHYALDSTAHGFVFGNTKDNREHKMLEASIDFIMHLDREGSHIRRSHTYKNIYVGKNLPDEVVEFYKKCALEVYDIRTNGNFINRAYRDYIKFLKLTNATNIAKVSLLKLVNMCLKESKWHYIYPSKVDENVLNEKMYKQFTALYDKAILYYDDLIHDKAIIDKNFNGEKLGRYK